MTDETTPRVPVEIPQTSNKAKVGAIIAGIGAFASALAAAVAAGDPNDLKDWVVIVALALATAAGTGFGVNRQANYVKRDDTIIESGELGVIATRTAALLALGLALLIVVVLFVRACDDDGRNDARHGNDWEYHPVGAIR